MGNFNFAQSEWREIEGFPKYEINSLGIVRNKITKVQISTQVGHIETVKLVREGRRYLRSVGKLVRTIFPELYP